MSAVKIWGVVALVVIISGLGWKVYALGAENEVLSQQVRQARADKLQLKKDAVSVRLAVGFGITLTS